MKNLILVAGAGRNVGKTTLTCLIIKELKKQHQLTAVKVSSHHHSITGQQKVIYEIEGLTISEEQDIVSEKDSSRFIRAGAKQSFFVQIIDEKMPELINWLKKNIEGMIVCESGTMGKFVIPAKAIFVDCDIPLKSPKWSFHFSQTKLVNNEFQPGLEELLKGIN